jgi:hypothetical protein
MPLSKLLEVSHFHGKLILGKVMPVDLMSVSPVDLKEETVWTFLSIAYGWIAHADIHTEALRYLI